MPELSGSWKPQLPRSMRKLELDGLLRALSPSLPNRVIVAGGPRSGKSHLAAGLRLRSDHALHGGEELVGIEWSAGSLAASLWLDEPGPWICENVAMPRALRKWLARAPDHVAPADLIVWLGEPVAVRSRGQHIMARGCQTVWNEIRPDLIRRGTRLLEL